VEKGDLTTVGAGARRLVDEDEALFAQFIEGGRQVWHPVAEVVYTMTAAKQELRDRAVRAEGCQEFDAPGPGPDEDDFDILGLHDFAAGGSGREEGFPERNCFIEGRYGDPYVIECPFVHR